MCKISVQSKGITSNCCEKNPQVPAEYLVENWFVGVLRNSSQWPCPQLRLNMLLLLGVVQGDIELHFIPTEYQLADIFTKPLDEPTFTRLKAELVVYRNFFMEFWCTAIAYDPNPPKNNFEARPLKEYLIKFSVMNGKKPLILDYKTFVESTGLDYAKGKYVSHPSTEEVKAELAKIVDNPILLDRTLVLKTAFPVAWRILFTSAVQVDIGEIIYSDLVTRLTNKSRLKYVSYPRFVSCALEVLLGSEYTQDESFGSSPTILSNLNFSKDLSKVTLIELTDFMVAVNNNEKSVNPLPFTIKKKKGKSQTVTSTLPQSQGPEASGSLPQKRKKPKSKKPPTETKGTRKSQLFPEGTKSNPKDSVGNKQSIDMGLPSTVSDEGAAKTMPLPEGPLGDKDSEGNKPPADMEPINPTVVDLSGTGAKYRVDETQSTRLSADDVLEAGEDMDEDTHADEEEHQSPPNTNKPEPSPAQETQESESDSSKKHEEAAVSYANLGASIEGYYEENVDHKEHTDKLVQETMDSLDKTATDRTNLLKDLNEVTETLKVIQDAVKDDPTLNKKVTEATKAYTKNSTALTELLTLVKNFDFQVLKSLVESFQAIALIQDENLSSWAKSSTLMAWNLGPRMTSVESSQAEIRYEISSLKSDTSEIKSTMTEIYKAFKGQSSTPSSSVLQTTLAITEGAINVGGENVTQADTEEPPSHTEGEHVAMKDNTKKPESDKAEEEPKHAVPISFIKPTKTPEVQPITTIISTNHMFLKEKEKALPLMSNLKEQILAHMDKEDQIKKAEEEAKRLAMTKTEVIKIVQEEAKKIEIDPKKVISAKAGEKFKKDQDAEMQVHKRQHTKKVKRLTKLNKKRVENNDMRNFVVHNPFKFADFGLTELDELGPIIEKKKNSIVKDLMQSLSKRYERLKKIPKELRIQSALPALVIEQAPS
ncbi:hypothetical protein Tco_1182023 [Tanacetum coccineum]